MKNIDISVVIPTHNRASYLFYELEQIYKQEGVTFEVYVINDVSETDPTDEITTRFPQVHYIKDNRIQGPSEKHKSGLRMACGRYIYMPDDDDYLVDTSFFRRMVAILDAHPKVAFASGGVELIYQDITETVLRSSKASMNVTGYINGADYLQEFQHKLTKPASTVSTIFRREALDAVGALRMKEFSDSSIYIACLLWGDAYIEEKIVAHYRILQNKSSLTYNPPVPFVLNVLSQKKDLYHASISRLKNPKAFWLNQVVCTYSFFTTSSKRRDERRILIWLMLHNGRTLRVALFALKRYIFSLFR